jgi:DNA-binding GntR family transcriptional regulator
MLQQRLPHRINAIQNTAEVIADSLREMIYEAELRPGQPLRQEHIAAMFQVSRVPVRDALQMLIRRGVAVNVPRRGVIVRPLSHRLLDELFEVRRILEGSAIRMVVRTATRELLLRLRELIRQQSECLRLGDVKRQVSIDDEFHLTLYEAAGNSRLLELIQGNWELIKQARCTSVVIAEHGWAWIAESIKRHRRILAALKQGDAESACRAIYENIQGSHREITVRLRQMGWIEPAADSGQVALPAPARRSRFRS